MDRRGVLVEVWDFTSPEGFCCEIPLAKTRRTRTRTIGPLQKITRELGFVSPAFWIGICHATGDSTESERERESTPKRGFAIVCRNHLMNASNHCDTKGFARESSHNNLGLSLGKTGPQSTRSGGEGFWVERPHSLTLTKRAFRVYGPGSNTSKT